MSARMMQMLSRLAKWRTVFAGWQLGTRPKGDPECDAVRDHREVTLILRAEVTALAVLLVQAGVCTVDQYETAVADEAGHLSKHLETRFPGMRADDEGIVMDVARARETMKGWRP